MKKSTPALLFAGLVLGGLGLRSYRSDRQDFNVHRRELLETLGLEIGRLGQTREETDARMAAVRTQITAQKARAGQAGKVARQLVELSGGFNRLTTSSAQLAENEARRERMKQMETGSRQRVEELEQSLVRSQWEKDGIEIALARKQEELSAVRADRSKVLHHIRLTWQAHGRWVLVAAGVAFLGSLLWRRRSKQ